ncbi:hypothetical protein ACJ41O_008738 [Fusarium nematophilum]
MASPSSSPGQSLGTAQGIGIGVVVGFVGALLLAAMVVYIIRADRFPGNAVISKLKATFRPPQKPRPDPLDAAVATTRACDPRVRNLPERMSPFGSARQIETHSVGRWELDSHVSSFILGDQHPSPIPESVFDEDQLVSLAGEPVNGGTWSGSFSNAATRRPAMKCFLAQVLFRRMDPLCAVEENLLPPEISTFYQYIFRLEKAWSDNAARSILAVFRETMYHLHLSHFDLWQDYAQCFSPLHPDMRRERTHAMASAVVDAIRYDDIGISRFSQDHEQSVKGLFEMAANAAMHFFVQPSEWEIVWASDKPGFIIYPEIRRLWNGVVETVVPAEVEEIEPPTEEQETGPSDERDESAAARE